jgi:hypothetical protein
MGTFSRFKELVCHDRCGIELVFLDFANSAT